MLSSCGKLGHWGTQYLHKVKVRALENKNFEQGNPFPSWHLVMCWFCQDTTFSLYFPFWRLIMALITSENDSAVLNHPLNSPYRVNTEIWPTAIQKAFSQNAKKKYYHSHCTELDFKCWAEPQPPHWPPHWPWDKAKRWCMAAWSQGTLAALSAVSSDTEYAAMQI